MNICRKIYKNFKGKNIAVFCVGASPFSEKAFEEIKKHNLDEELKSIPAFYGRGMWDESKMNVTDRILCNILKKSISRIDSAHCEPWMESLRSALGQKFDWTDKTYLTSLVNYIKTENSKPSV